MPTTSGPTTSAPSTPAGPIVRLFGREPAVWLALAAAAVQLVSAFFLPLTDVQQGSLNAVAVAAVGFLTAWQVSKERALPAVLGVIQAALALGLSFGWHLSPERQAVIMSVAAAIVAMFVRTQVEAPVDREGFVR